jgi:aminopeptidase N
MKKHFTTFSILISLFTTCFAQINAPIDVLHYRFALTLSDNSDEIIGQTTVQFKAIQATNTISLDLVQANKEKGMTVSKVSEGILTLSFSQNNNKLDIILPKPLQIGEIKTIEIAYSGIPADGLIISKNNHGHRTFFADNWPNRAHNWLPCIDEPRDKATVEFLVTAPQHYQIVSNGLQIEETNIDAISKLTHWKEDTPLPTKIMVIGAADFAVHLEGQVNCVPVYSWTFPEDKNTGFPRYAQAKEILSFFMNYVGEYGYKKLANVQSKTMFGGMENAGAIFYYENSAIEDSPMESLLAHEIAHQWFGDMVTEKQFAHIWLSEGFATYLTHIYMESKYGRDTILQKLADERTAIIAFSKNNNNPIIDSISPYMDLLNLNSYEKASWVLHILRNKMGKDKFQQLLRRYYEQFKGKNADTQDFQKLAEGISGENLNPFFKQWFYTAGQPDIKVSWAKKGKKIEITIEQLQQTPFEFPLDILFKYPSGQPVVKTFDIKNAKQVFSFKSKEMPIELVLDPNTVLLFEGSVVKE